MVLVAYPWSLSDEKVISVRAEKLVGVEMGLLVPTKAFLLIHWFMYSCSTRSIKGLISVQI